MQPFGGCPKLRCCNQRQYHEACKQRSLRAPTQAWPLQLTVPGGSALSPVHSPATMASIGHTFASLFLVYVPWGRAGLGCKVLQTSSAFGSLLTLHFPHPTFPLIHFRSCPTSTHIPDVPPALPPKSFGSPPSFLHPITFRPSSCTSPSIQCPHSCPTGSALLHMVLGAGCFQSFPSILPQCQQEEE